MTESARSERPVIYHGRGQPVVLSTSSERNPSEWTTVAAPDSGAVIIPCYNHVENLAGVVAEVRAIVPNLPVVVIDDGSEPPVTPLPGVDLIRHAANRGKGEAILSGIRHFRDREYVILVDADGQHPVDEIPRLLSAFRAAPKADLVTSSRDLIHDRSIPLRHRVANLLLSVEFALLNGHYFPDVTNGFRVVRIRTLLALNVRFKRFEVEVETLRGMIDDRRVIRTVPTHGVKYGSPSGVRRGLRITFSIALAMVTARLRSDDPARSVSPSGSVGS